VLVIDAIEGVAENSKRHGLLLSLLGISQVLVAVTKLDLCGYDEGVFKRLVAEYGAYLASLKVKPLAFIPVSAREGKNITVKAAETPWYEGKTMLEALDNLENRDDDGEKSFFAMPLQDIYRFSDDNDERRIYAGTIVSGEIHAGDRVRFLPSNKDAQIARIEAWNAPEKTRASVGDASGFTLREEIYVKRGELMVKVDEHAPVSVGARLRANLIWLGLKPFVSGRDYLIKLGAAKVHARLEAIERFLGETERENPDELRRHECGSVILSLSEPVAFTAFEHNASLGRFVIVDGYDAAGGGIVLDAADAASTRNTADIPAGFEDELFTLLKKYFPQRFVG
jgi:bifunctional enzyme CysN/CysC/sulfate adenylyltransferase subunit 1